MNVALILVSLGIANAPLPLVDRMERVDKHVGATKRNPSRDATVTDPGDNVSFRSAC